MLLIGYNLTFFLCALRVLCASVVNSNHEGTKDTEIHGGERFPSIIFGRFVVVHFVQEGGKGQAILVFGILGLVFRFADSLDFPNE